MNSSKCIAGKATNGEKKKRKATITTTTTKTHEYYELFSHKWVFPCNNPRSYKSEYELGMCIGEYIYMYIVITITMLQMHTIHRQRRLE